MVVVQARGLRSPRFSRPCFSSTGAKGLMARNRRRGACTIRLPTDKGARFLMNRSELALGKRVEAEGALTSDWRVEELVAAAEPTVFVSSARHLCVASDRIRRRTT